LKHPVQKVLFSGIEGCVVRRKSNVSEENALSIFRVEEQIGKEPDWNRKGNYELSWKNVKIWR
jgi:hypothetical protein